MKANNDELELKFDRNQEDILEYFDLSQAERINLQQKQIDLNLPVWMIEALDREASHLGVAREAIIKIWLANKLKESSSVRLL